MPQMLSKTSIQPSTSLAVKNGSRMTKLFQILASPWQDLWSDRDLIWILFTRDLKSTFRGSLLGWFWLLLPPLATTLIWIMLNRSRVVAFTDPTVPYPLFVLTGTILWTAFTRAALLPLQIFQASKPVFTKIKVSPAAFLAVGPLRSAFDSIFFLLILLILFPVFGHIPPATILLLPLAILVAVALGTAMAWLLMPLAALYSDVQQGLPLLFSVLIYVAPVVYPMPESGWLRRILLWNPITPVIMAARDWTFHGGTNWWPGVLAALLLAFIMTWAALLALRLMMPHLVARMGM
jgi:lipopolysaccharide transport system permease protein